MALGCCALAQATAPQPRTHCVHTRNVSSTPCCTWPRHPPHPPCRFFKRYNTVVLDVAAVGKERSRLEQENADLRQLLKTFLDGIRCVLTVGVAACRQRPRVPQGSFKKVQAGRAPGPCVASSWHVCRGRGSKGEHCASRRLPCGAAPPLALSVQEPGGPPVCHTDPPGSVSHHASCMMLDANVAGASCRVLSPACSVNETVLNSPTNPLLVVNQRLQQTMAQQRKQRTAGQQPGSPKLMLSGVAAGTGPGVLGSPKGGSGGAAAAGKGAAFIGPLSGRSVLSASPAGAAGAGHVAGSLLMSPRSTTAPASAVRGSR
jgi:hypothetical protein